MKRYYVYFESWTESSLADCYNAYSDNQFLMKQYLNQMESMLNELKCISPIYSDDIVIIDTTTDTEDEFIDRLNMTKAGAMFTKEHKLYSVSSFDGNSQVILNKFIYNKFVEGAYINAELSKIDHNLYRLCSSYATNYVKKYVVKDYSDLILKILSKIYDQHRILRDKLTFGGDFTLLNTNRLNSELWDIMDESIEMYNYIKYDIFRIFNLFTLPFR